MRRRLTHAVSLGLLAILAEVGAAQSFNLDVADLAGVPTPLYAAAAAQPGTWNVLTGGPPYAGNMVDLTGGATTITTSVVAVGNGLGDFTFDNVGTTGDDQALMDDLQDVGNGGSPSSTTWTFAGLQDGTYDIYVYAWAPDSAAFISFVSQCGGVVTQVSGNWPGNHAEGVTYARFAGALVCGGQVEICVDGGGIAANFSSVNGFQFVRLGNATCEPGTAACFGDGSGTTACPCGNDGGAGTGGGCANGAPMPAGQGAVLSSSGTNSVVADDLVLTADFTTNQPGLFFQGDNSINGGNGIAFGDGLRCCGSNVVRLEIGDPAGANGPHTTSTTAAVLGTSPAGTTASGDTRCYQWWYRNPNRSLCGSNFNLSNSVVVTWAP